MAGDRTNITLMQRIKNRMDQVSWSEFTETYTPYIKPILLHFKIPIDHVDDLTQDIFIRVWKSIENFEYDPQKCKFRTWLSTVCRNTIYDYFSKRQTLVFMDTVPELPIDPEMDEVIEREWKIYIASKAMKNVAQRFAPNIMQAYLEFQNGSNVKDIAEKLNIVEGSVYTYNSRIKAELSREIVVLSNYLG